MGIAGSTTGELVFDGCRVPAPNRLGGGGDGVPARDEDPRPLATGRRGAGAGIAQGATDYALEYARTRETMGKPIAEHQLIAAKLADMETTPRRRAACSTASGGWSTRESRRGS